METSRIAILDQNDTVVGFLDNSLPEALPFWDDELHEYLEGTSNTFTFKTDARHHDSLNLVEGYHIAFKLERRDYYLNIMRVIRDEDTVEIEAWSTNLELLNEQVAGIDPGEAHSFLWYKNQFDPENTVQIGLNEVSDKQIKNKWDGESTVLSRLYSLANIFGAEIEFVPVLNADYSLNKFVMNVYREHGDTNQGIGKADVANLVYGRDIQGVKKTSDITDLYTCIFPHGGTPEGSQTKIDISGVNHTVTDTRGRTEYFTDGGLIRAPLARDRFPSFMSQSNDRYILVHWEYDTLDKEVLYGQALAQLKKNCVPKVTYEIDGYADTGIGDTVRITDEEYNPILYLDARVTEQVRSFTDPSRNKTIYSNIEVLKSEVDSSLMARVEALIAENKVYAGSIASTNGIQFVNGTGSTTLIARVMDGVTDIAASCTIVWYRDGEEVARTRSITVDATEIITKSVYKFEAILADRVVSSYEVTVTNIKDGNKGDKGDPGESPTITSQVREYIVANDGTTIPTGSWTTTIPAAQPGQYLWTRLVCYWSDGKSTTQYTIAKQGINGGKGDKGDPGSPGESAITIVAEAPYGTEWKAVTTSLSIIAHIFRGSHRLTSNEAAAIGTISWYRTGRTEPVAQGQTLVISNVTETVEYHAEIVNGTSTVAIGAPIIVRKSIDEAIEKVSADLITEKDSILQTVEGNYYSKTNGEKLATRTTDVETRLGAFTVNFSETQGNVQLIEKYFRVEESDDSAKVTIGGSHSDIRLVMENDILYFMQAGQEGAYFANGGMLAKRSTILEYLDLCGLEIVKATNGSVDIK